MGRRKNRNEFENNLCSYTHLNSVIYQFTWHTSKIELVVAYVFFFNEKILSMNTHSPMKVHVTVEFALTGSEHTTSTKKKEKKRTTT